MGNILKSPAIKVIGGVGVVVLLFLGMQTLRDSKRLSYLHSDASCYGLNCVPTVTLVGKISSLVPGHAHDGFIWPTLNSKVPTQVDLTWNTSAGFERCEPNWVEYYNPIPQIFTVNVTSSRKFKVDCYLSGIKYSSVFTVNISTAQTAR